MNVGNKEELGGQDRVGEEEHSQGAAVVWPGSYKEPGAEQGGKEGV